MSNGTHILASWNEPEYPNGALRYSITLTSTDLLTGLTTDIVRDEVVFESEFELGYLVDFYVHYGIIVIPITGAGAGNSSMDSFDTDQGSKYAWHFLAKCSPRLQSMPITTSVLNSSRNTKMVSLISFVLL